MTIPRLTKERVHKIMDEFWISNQRKPTSREIIQINGGGAFKSIVKHEKDWVEPETTTPEVKNALLIAMKLIDRKEKELEKLRMENTELKARLDKEKTQDGDT